MRVLLLMIFLLTFAKAQAQDPVVKKPLDTTEERLDTIASPTYVNQGKIAGKKAFHRSLIFPGLGQIYNYGLVVKDVQTGAVKGKKVAQKIYILAKLSGIYVGGTMLALSYVDNRKNYKEFLGELQYRREHKDEPNPEGRLARYTNSDALTVAKNIYKRNSQVVLISFVGLYALSAVDAYVTARLKYFNIDQRLTFKVSPSTINAAPMYGFNAAPAIKLTIRL